MDDSDLYGDLYGGEYDEPSTTEGEKTTTTSPDDKASEKPKDSTSDSTVKPPAAAAPTTAIPKPQPISTSSAVTPTPVPAPIPTAQVGNSIATYSSRDGGTSYNYPPTQQQPQQRSDPASQFAVGGPHDGQPIASAVPGNRDQDGEHPVRPSEMRDEGKMFVGGLNWETTTESLQAYFSQFGKVDACTIMRDGAGRSRGFAFLTFEDAAAVNAVMVREHYLDGKIIDPKRAIPRLEHQRTQKLFVGGLAPSVTQDTLKTYFSQHGNVIDATVMVDRESGRSKGFGFVTFEDGHSLDHLLGHGIVLDGKVIEVKLAQPRHQTQRQNGNEDGSGGGGGGAGGGYNRNQGGGGGYNQGPQQGGGMPQTGGGAAAPAFDAQAMANLYQRMMSVAQTGGFMGMGGGGMMGGMGGAGRGMGMMGPAGMGGMGMGGGMGGMGMPMGAGGMMGPGAGMGRGGPMMGGGGNMAPGMGVPGGGMGGAPPRGPRAGVGAPGPQGQQGPSGPAGGTGPMRSHGMRGQNTYHPYGRG